MNKPEFLSLKWQAVISVSLILVTGVGLITYFGKNNLEQTYHNQRERVLQDRHQAVASSQHAIQLQLMHLARHMQGLRGRNQTQAHTPLPEVLNKHWDQLNFEWGVDAVILYDTRATAQFSLGAPAIAQRLPKEWVLSTGRSETPMAQIWCQRSCWQVVLVPTLLNSTDTGILVLAQSLADALLQFQSSTAADIGILVPQTADSHRVDTRPLPDWQRDVVALTGAPSSYRLLQSLSEQLPIDSLAKQRTLRQWQQHNFEISLIPLTETAPTNTAALVVIDNISADLQRLQKTVSNLSLSALLILILAEAALLSLLWGPMSRLRAVAQLLPRLARSNRQGLQQKLGELNREPRLRNEINMLFDSASLLSQTLEELDKTVEIRTQGLKQRSQELLEERNFIGTLLNNVHAVILTQDAYGRIHLLNAEGCKLLDIKQEEAHQHRFCHYLGEEDRDQVQTSLQKLLTHVVTHVRHENNFHSPQAGTLHMEWQHTRLPDSATHEAQILSVGVDLTARKQAESNLAWLADHDPLTELFNRRRFQLEFKKALQKSMRNKHPGALIFFDLDQFKSVNDTSGHPTGDRLLCEVAHKLVDGIREVDVLARLGGDEFALVAEETDLAGAIALADKLCALIGGTDVVAGDTVHSITISMGIALFPAHGTDMDELMANADLAMYKAKASGVASNNWHLYSVDAPDKQELQQRVNWKARIQKALEDERFQLYFQPIYNIAQGTIAHYEALVRMVDEQGDIVPPGQFIPVAEKTGLIYAIDRLVMRQAVIALSQFHSQGKTIALSVNLSATAIAKIDFISFIEGLVEQHRIERSKLIFELTETSAVEDITTTADVIGKCRALGYQFSLDDFGVGFASWFYLRQLPVDYVKIDGSFVRHLSDNNEDRLFVKAINDVAQGLGKKTVAEFVENEETLQLLATLGVDYAQGYHIGKPQPQLLEGESNLKKAKLTAPADTASEPQLWH